MPASPRPGRRSWFVAALFLVLTLASAATVATAEPTPTDADGSHLDHIDTQQGDTSDMYVYSAAMNTVIKARVLRAADPGRPAPTLYLLNGANGGVGGSWYDETDVAGFFADKQVNVVIPIGGAGSYFTDWRAADPILGRPRWTTFLTRELPPIVDTALNGNGSNAIAGISMAGTAVFQLAESRPGLYRAIASYSGCVPTSDPLGQAFVTAVVARQAGNAANMWGPPGDPEWAAMDPALHADRLRGTAIYISTGSGLPGPLDTADAAHGDLIQLTWQLLFGSPLETLADDCTRRLQERLRQSAVAATFDFRPTGTHSWGYWQQDLHRSWPQLEAALTGCEVSQDGAHPIC
ncbi:alpha/beta hydrolase [Nocardia heshunensis]